MPNVDLKHYSDDRQVGEPRGPVTDGEGRVTLPALIPGALYRISDYSTVNVEGRLSDPQGLHRQAG